MEIYVNSVKADFILENEKTLGDILKAFALECEKNAATVVAVSADGQNIEASQMDVLFEKPIENVNRLDIETVMESDIIRSLLSVADKTSVLSECMEQIPVLLQSGKDVQAAQTVTAFTEVFNELCRTVNWCALFPKRFGGFTIDGQAPAVFLKDFSPVLTDFEKSLTAADTVLTGDLAEYEIVPRLRSFAKAVHTYCKENSC